MPAIRNRVFISYSHKDKRWLDEMLPFLRAFEREFEMKVWVDRQIRAGARWKEEMEDALETTKVALLLVTANYLASDFIAGNELPPLMKSQGEGLTIVWVALSASSYDVTAIKDYQAVNDPTKPLDMLPSGRRRQEWEKVAKSVWEAYKAGGPDGGEDNVSDNEESSPPPMDGRVVLLYKRNAKPDQALLDYLLTELEKRSYPVFVDKHLRGGMVWAKEISEHLERASAVIPLLSHTAVQSEMLAYEIQIVHAASERGRPRILPVRVAYDEDLEAPFDLLNPLQHVFWKSSADNARVLDEVLAFLNRFAEQPPRFVPSRRGALKPGDPLYIERPSDNTCLNAVSRLDSVILIKGARQMGKTSLVARALRHARELGFATAYMDFQKFNADQMASQETFYKALLEWLADSLKLTVDVDAQWNQKEAPNQNLERILLRAILQPAGKHVVWAMDELERLFSPSIRYSGEFFALIRSWYNDRSVTPDSPWEELTVIIAYATELHTLITLDDQSPFNVGVRADLADFTQDEVNLLNTKMGGSLSWADVKDVHDYLGGQPFLCQRGLGEMVVKHWRPAQLFEVAARDDGPFGDHLRRLLVTLARNEDLLPAVQSLLDGKPRLDENQLYRLRRGGIASGATPGLARLRCKLYRIYLEQHQPAAEAAAKGA